MRDIWITALFAIAFCALMTAVMYLGFKGYITNAAALVLMPLALITAFCWWKVKDLPPHPKDHHDE